MSTSRRSLLRVSLLSATLLLLGAPNARAGSPRRKLFVITRSTNANTVHYDLRLKKDGSVDADDPASVYWVMSAEDGRREGLTWLERQFAYGYSVVGAVEATGFRMRLAAFSARDIHVERDASAGWRAQVTIAGRRAALERVHVQAGSGTSVRWVDLHGTALGTGDRVTERLTG